MRSVALGQIGAWIGAFTNAPAAEARPVAREIEELGYDTLWYPEGLGTRESFTNGAVLLGATERIRVASGIANIWARDPVAAANAVRVLGDAFDDRFLLGLGVSHPRQVDPRGHRYEHPVERMSAYLDAMDADPVVSPDTEGEVRPPVPRVLAALRPKMLRLAGEKASGAHTYLVPVEHTRRARELLGPDKLLIVEQKVALGDGARAGARSDRVVPRHAELPEQPPLARLLRGRLRGRRLRCPRRCARRRGRRGGDSRAGTGAPGRGSDPGRDSAARGRGPVRPRDAAPAGACAYASGVPVKVKSGP